MCSTPIFFVFERISQKFSLRVKKKPKLFFCATNFPHFFFGDIASKSVKLAFLFRSFFLSFPCTRLSKAAPRQHFSDSFGSPKKNLFFFRSLSRHRFRLLFFSFCKPPKISHTLWGLNFCHIGIFNIKAETNETAQLNSAQVNSRMSYTNMFLPFPLRFLFFVCRFPSLVLGENCFVMKEKMLLNEFLKTFVGFVRLWLCAS